MEGAELCRLLMVLTRAWLGECPAGVGGHCCSPWWLAKPRAPGLGGSHTECRHLVDRFGSNMKIDVSCLACVESLGRVS